MKPIVLFDYGVGNLHSLYKALSRHGDPVNVRQTLGDLDDARALVLPGVGAFGAAARTLSPQADAIRRAIGDGLPCLGICLGMQLLFESSEEGDGPGLGLIAGHVRRLDSERFPQMGWNDVETSEDPLFDGSAGLTAYYANSYVAAPAHEDDVLAWSTYYGDRFPAVVRAGRVIGIQFHPEKSGAAGLRLLDNYLNGIR
jgi:imidazole glycerol-phosphate synthase subunit HisH